jgi:hypothetical protein
MVLLTVLYSLPRERKTHELRYRWGLDKEIEDDQEENPSFHADATAEDPVTGETIGIRSSFRNLIALFRVMFVSGFYVLWTVAAGFIILCKEGRKDVLTYISKLRGSLLKYFL